MSTSYGVLSTYPPTQCGLATFTSALVQSLRSQTIGVVEHNVDVASAPRSPEVRHQWVRGAPRRRRVHGARLNGFGVVVVQHEYGIFGGPDGHDVLDIVGPSSWSSRFCTRSWSRPTHCAQKAILDELILLSDSVVTMTVTARRLIHRYLVDEDKIGVIPHGAIDPRVEDGLHCPAGGRSGRPTSRE